MPKDNPALFFNQTIMEFGALQCITKYNCGGCVLTIAAPLLQKEN
jgi:adenine-specific DNA glycosylase